MAASSLLLPSLIVPTPKTLTLTPIPSKTSLAFSFNNRSSLPLLRKARSFGPTIATRVAAVPSELEEEEELSGDEQNFPPELKVYVGNLPFTVNSEELAELFGSAGTVEMVEVIYDKLTGRSRGFGFVTMSTTDEVEAAVQQFNGHEFNGRALRVNSGPPPPREESPSRGSRFGGGGSSFESGHKLFVGNLSWGVDNMALENLFSEQGKVIDARVVIDRDTGRSRGFGFVTYSSAEEANNAISSLDGSDLDGRNINVAMAESRPPRRQF